MRGTAPCHFSIRKDTDEENPSSFTVLKGDDRHKNKKITATQF